MSVELLVVPDCPHVDAARRVLHAALAMVGLTDETVVTVVIESQADADRTGFTGSPSYFVDGRDVLPMPGRVPALACRLSGVPSVEVLAAALRQSAGTAGLVDGA